MKKLISVFLTLCMVLSMLVLPTFAATNAGYSSDIASADLPETELPAYSESASLDKTEYKISSKESLEELAKWVNTGAKNFSGITVYLAGSINMSGSTMAPIGNATTAFEGNFDGRGKSISNLVMTTTEKFVGLFGYAKGGTIANVVLDNTCSFTCNASGAPTLGGVASVVANANGITVSNVKSAATVTNNVATANQFTGGIVGQTTGTAVTINYSTFAGKVVSSASSTTVRGIGGILGRTSVKATVSYCVNDGSVTTAKGEGAGGIVGMASASSVIEYCVHNGSVDAKNQQVGGMVGVLDGTVDNCTNNGIVKGSGNSVGGMAGQISANAKVTNCTATATATVNGAGQVGGMVGVAQGAGGQITNCVNNSAVTGTSSNVGGIMGRAAYEITFIECVNNGTIKGTQCIGGILGIRNSSAGGLTIEKCMNTGDIYGTGSGNTGRDIGGILGTSVGSSTAYIDSISIKDCTNCGSIYTNITSVNKGDSIGGVVGRFQAYSVGTVSGCQNFGTVGSEANAGLVSGAGILGCSQAKSADGTVATISIANCTNYGKINAKAVDSGLSGLVSGWNGNCRPTISGSADKQSYTTHLIGYQMTEIYNNGEEDVQDIRFVATIDSLNYSEVGFNIVVKNSNGETLASFSDASDYVYTKLLAVESEGDILRDNYRKGGYLFALSITGVTAGNYIFEVETYAKDMDGNAVSTSCDVKTTSAITFGDMGN